MPGVEGTDFQVKSRRFAGCTVCATSKLVPEEMAVAALTVAVRHKQL